MKSGTESGACNIDTLLGKRAWLGSENSEEERWSSDTFHIYFSPFKSHMISTDPWLVWTVFILIEMLSRPWTSQPDDLASVEKDEGDRHQQNGNEC